MDKAKIYGQIDSFFNSKENKNDSKRIGEKYFYIDRLKAEYSASFFAHFLNETNINLNKNLNVMDLCFGSANLTSHIVLDNELDTNKIYLNDIDKNVTNQQIKIDTKSEILNLDFLDFKQFNTYENNIDILVFNPTISDSDIHRKISIKETDSVIEYQKSLDIEEAFKEYCEKLSLKIIDEISVDSVNKTIKVQIDGTKKFLDKLPNSFNNYSLICKTKNMTKYEARNSTVTQINQTISKILKDNGIVVFVGTDKQRETIFQNYNTVFRYLREDNDVFIIQKSEEELLQCFEKQEDEFIENDDCEIKKKGNKPPESFDNITLDVYDFLSDKEETKEEEEKTLIKEEKNKINYIEFGNLTFPHKNILLKGVPGTGKSRAIENIINDKLELKDHKENVLRVNIHSASSNADLMQGIGISSKDGQIEYKEKQGLILNLIQRATFNPNQPFVLVLEEIQENSLNELIGDLIYLIEDSKRAKNLVADDEEYSYEALVEKIIVNNPETDYVEIPYLVNDSTAYRKMIMPNNLYIFCTSNYRDDKKVIKDNLLRRFEVLEIYPKNDVVSDYCKEFFSQLNKNILEVMNDEIHPDRFLIGHSNWLKKYVKDEKSFYRAFLKVVVEFKDIKEVEFSDFKKIVEKLPLVEELNFNSYKDLIEDLQAKAGYDFLD